MFPKKRIPTIMCCTILLAIVLFSLTGCGGGGGGDDDDDPVVYRLAKYEEYDASATTASKTCTISYNSGTPVQAVITSGTETATATLTVAFTNGIVSSRKMTATVSGANFVDLVTYEHTSGLLTKFTSYSTESTSGPDDEYCDITYVNGKRDSLSLYEYDVDTSTHSLSEYAKFRYSGEQITEIDYYSDSADTTINYCVKFLYDANGNVIKATDYDSSDGGTTFSEGSHTVFTWEKRTSTFDWNNYYILLDE